LIRHHYEKCPDCSRDLAESEEVRSLLIKEVEANEISEFWTSLKARYKSRKNRRTPLFTTNWKWAYQAVGLVLFAVLAIWIFISVNSNVKDNNVESFRINYIKINNQPAQAYIYHPKDTNMVLVWAEKSSEGE
jgi:hypothetical protein